MLCGPSEKSIQIMKKMNTNLIKMLYITKRGYNYLIYSLIVTNNLTFMDIGPNNIASIFLYFFAFF